MKSRPAFGATGAGLLAAVLLLGLPLAGVAMAGRDVSVYLEFPPLTQYVRHAPFSWTIFVVGAVLELAVLLPFVARVLRGVRGGARRLPQPEPRPFPWWGWLGLGICAAAWVLAWTRFRWFAPFQLYSFAPLWGGFIVVLNALQYKRSGHSLLTDRTTYFLRLFPASAVFWWFFEYLNRFVQNWYYEGGAGLSACEYFLIGSIHFSTVLPAVLSVHELLATMPRLSAGMDDLPNIDMASPKAVARLNLAAACTGLALIGVWPDFLFPLLWLSPLLIITSLQTLRGRSTILTPLRSGSWTRIQRLALAALICGFFWEMWNVHSFAKWIYAVPYVGRFKLFEMPALGYFGYLPFGLECAVIADLFETAAPAEARAPATAR